MNAYEHEKDGINYAMPPGAIGMAAKVLGKGLLFLEDQGRDAPVAGYLRVMMEDEEYRKHLEMLGITHEQVALAIATLASGTVTAILESPQRLDFVDLVSQLKGISMYFEEPETVASDAGRGVEQVEEFLREQT